MYKDAPASEADWGQGLAAALRWLSEPKAGHYLLARSGARDAACGRTAGQTRD